MTSRRSRSALLVAAVGAATLVVFVVLVVVALNVRSTTEPSSAASVHAGHPGRAIPAGGPGFPSPPAGAVVYSRQLGSKVLALAIVPGERELLVQASVVGSTGNGVSGLDVEAVVEGSSQPMSPCGPGCYRATVPAAGRPTFVELRLGGEPTRWQVALPAKWPPTDASAMMARATRVWKSLRSLSFTDRLASDEEHVVKSTWRVQGPDRLAYEIAGGSSAVIIGERRWDKDPGGRWRSSQQTPIRQPTPAWVAVTNARVLGTATVRGRPAWKVSFFDPQTPGWFTVLLDRRTLRTLQLSMMTTAHFMHETYMGFNATPEIRAPR